MAVEWPHAWIVFLELENHVAVVACAVGRGNDVDVAHLGVGWVDDGAVPGADARGEDIEVVAVKMLWRD